VCDTVVSVPEDGPVWLAKNSDREPGEAQAVEWVAATGAGAPRRRCTHLTVNVPTRRNAVVLCRPVWMWGAEMGVNAHGVAIGNEAVFTREPVAPMGLTGMDLLRLALEQADSAEAALDVIVDLLERHPQGGRMSYRGRLRYHSSFAIADRVGAWILETAGRFWAARRVQGVATISNGLTIGTDFDRIHPEAEAHARRRGWVDDGQPFDFAEAFGTRGMAVVCGAAVRRAATKHGVESLNDLSAAGLARVLSSHAGADPRAGWRMTMPCAHASWVPTRAAGQTTGSLIARLGDEPRVWATGTSSPCLSVFKPVSLRADVGSADPPAGQAADAASLWWRHERLHRATIVDHGARRAVIADRLAALQAGAWDAVEPRQAREVWREHRAAMPALLAAVSRVVSPRFGPYARYWARQSRRDGLSPDLIDTPGSSPSCNREAATRDPGSS
jgi:secernin